MGFTIARLQNMKKTTIAIFQRSTGTLIEEDAEALLLCCDFIEPSEASAVDERLGWCSRVEDCIRFVGMDAR